MGRKFTEALATCLAMFLLLMPVRMVAQSRTGLRVGLTNIPMVPVPGYAGVAAQSDHQWVKGAAIGGAIGLGLALLYHAVLVPDSMHNGRRVVELTLLGAVIGSLIGKG